MVIAGGTVEVEATEVADDWGRSLAHLPRRCWSVTRTGVPAVWIRPPWEPERADLPRSWSTRAGPSAPEPIRPPGFASRP